MTSIETAATTRQTSLSMRVLMTPDLANFSGNVHGGSLLKLLDQVAYACASRYAATYVVTLSVDRMLFREVVRVGQLRRPHLDEDIRRGTKRHVDSSYFTMVAFDADGDPVELPPLSPATGVEARRFADARRRRHAQRAAFATEAPASASREEEACRRHH